MIVTYISNNSGGSWWLGDNDWKALEAAGWEVKWFANEEYYQGETTDGRWLGALASEAKKDFPTIDLAIAEWEHVTGQCADDEGCRCCGSPHFFYNWD